jgi:hypothetical protein
MDNYRNVKEYVEMDSSSEEKHAMTVMSSLTTVAVILAQSKLTGHVPASQAPAQRLLRQVRTLTQQVQVYVNSVKSIELQAHHIESDCNECVPCCADSSK